MPKANAPILAAVGLPRGPRHQPQVRGNDEDTARMSAKLPIDLFVRLKAKVAERRTSIQDVAVQMFTRYVDED